MGRKGAIYGEAVDGNEGCGGGVAMWGDRIVTLYGDDDEDDEDDGASVATSLESSSIRSGAAKRK